MTKIEMKSKGAALRSSEKRLRRLLSAAAVLLAVCLAFVGAAGADAVAKIDGKEGSYGSIQDAINAAASGDKILVTASHNLDTQDSNKVKETIDGDNKKQVVLILVDGKDITIDLNGYTVTADYSDDNWDGGQKVISVIGVANTPNSKLTMTDTSPGKTGTLKIITTEDNADSNKYKVCYMLYNFNTQSNDQGPEEKCSLVINGGNYLFDHGASCIVYAWGDETTLVNGGNFRLDNVGTLSNGSPWIFNAKEKNERNIIVKGGTFNADIVHQYYPFEVSVPKEKALVENPTGIWTIVDDAVAYVNEQEWSSKWYTNQVGYATLQDALNNAGSAKEITSGNTIYTSKIEDVYLLTDCSVEKTLKVDDDITIHLKEETEGDAEEDVRRYTLLWKGDITKSIFDVSDGKTLTIDSFKIGDEFKIKCEGYEIGGWYTKNANGDEVSLEDSEVAVLISLYAKEPIANKYTITFNTDGGSAVGAITQDYGTEIIAPANPTKTGYTFDGWNPELPETMPVNGQTVTAQWKANQYTVTFDANGGTSTLDTLLVTYDTQYANLPNAEKSGHTFLYWKHDDGTEVTNETVVKTAKDHTLTAVWEEIPSDEPTSSGGSEGGYLSFPRTTENGGLVDFGSSKVVKAVLLPEGSSGSVVLKVDTIEKWPKELETEYTFDISVEKLGEGMAYIHFEIPESTLESLGITPADICAYHLVDGEWVKLRTTYEVKDGTVFYEAETDSFSPFKLVIEEGAAAPKEQQTESVILPTEEPKDEPIEVLPPIEEPVDEPETPKTPAPILAVLAGLGAAAVLRRK